MVHFPSSNVGPAEFQIRDNIPNFPCLSPPAPAFPCKLTEQGI